MHERDQKLLAGSPTYRDLFPFASENGIEVLESKVVNKTTLIELLQEKGVNAAFSFSCRSIIREEFIQSMGGRVFNIHPSLLPNKKVGGVFSWRILNDENFVAATLRLIDSGILIFLASLRRGAPRAESVLKWVSRDYR